MFSVIMNLETLFRFHDAIHISIGKALETENTRKMQDSLSSSLPWRRPLTLARSRYQPLHVLARNTSRKQNVKTGLHLISETTLRISTTVRASCIRIQLDTFISTGACHNAQRHNARLYSRRLSNLTSYQPLSFGHLADSSSRHPALHASQQLNVLTKNIFNLLTKLFSTFWLIYFQPSGQFIFNLLAKLFFNLLANLFSTFWPSYFQPSGQIPLTRIPTFIKWSGLNQRR
jgi:hypothetical protein